MVGYYQTLFRAAAQPLSQDRMGCLVSRKALVHAPWLSLRAGSTNSWTNDISLKIRVLGRWAKSLKRMWWDNFRSIRNGRRYSWFRSCRDIENQIKSLISAGSKINAVEQARLAQCQGIASTQARSHDLTTPSKFGIGFTHKWVTNRDWALVTHNTVSWYR